MNINENRIYNYLKSSKEELYKVSWPTQKTVINHTLLVIGISLCIALFLGLLDMLFSWGIKEIVSR